MPQINGKKESGYRVRIIKWMLSLILFYSLYLAFIFFYHTRFIFPATQVNRVHGAEFGHDKDSFMLETGFGKVEAIFLPAEDPSSCSAVLFAHGNFELIAQRKTELSFYRKLGFGVLMVEYPGYGSSEGIPDERSVVEAYKTGYDWLIRSKKAEAGRIAGHGFSIGGAVICSLARERPLRAIILQSSMKSISSIAATYFVPAFVMTNSFDSIGFLKSYRNPVLIFHGRRDEVIPVHHAMEMKSAAADSRLVLLSCGHNDCIMDSEFQSTVKEFLIR